MNDQKSAGGLAEVFAAFLKLGLTSFGGPIAHLGYFTVALTGFLLLTVWKLAPWIVVVLLATTGAILRLI